MSPRRLGGIRVLQNTENIIKEYEPMKTTELVAKTQNNTFANPELSKAAEDIRNLDLMVRMHIDNAKVEIARIIANLDNSQAYEKDGFDSVVDFGMKVFGWGKSTAQAYNQVGHYIISGKPILDKNGNQFNSTQIRAMAGVKDVKALEKAVAEGEFTVDMSEDEFIKTRNAINPPKKTAVRKEKDVTIFAYGVSEPVYVGSATAFENNTEPHHTYTKDGYKWYVCLTEEGPMIFYHSTGKVVATVEATPV